MNSYEINYLLYNTPTIFHNKGLSIYALKEKIVEKSDISYIEDFKKLEKVFIPFIDEVIVHSTNNIKNTFINIFNDLKIITSNLIKNCAYQAVLLSHKNLKHHMHPHIHRQAYAINQKKCVTIHYNIGKNNSAFFDYWEKLSPIEIINNNLCDNKSIDKWTKNKSFNTLNLSNKRNIIIFDSGSIPHRVRHTSDLNLYFIFDYADLKIPIPSESIILFE